jgi:hypothetical protein
MLKIVGVVAFSCVAAYVQRPIWLLMHGSLFLR